MKHADVKMTFRAECKSVYRLESTEGALYPFACPRKRKNPEVPVISVCQNVYPQKDKPEYYIKNGLSENLTGMFFNPETGKGYGNSRDKADVFLFDWDSAAGTMTILVLRDESQKGTMDKLFYRQWLAGGVSEIVLIHRLTIPMLSVTEQAETC